MKEVFVSSIRFHDDDGSGGGFREAFISLIEFSATLTGTCDARQSHRHHSSDQPGSSSFIERWTQDRES